MKIPAKICLAIILSAFTQAAWCETQRPLQAAEQLKGRIVDAQNQKPIAHPLISVLWKLKFKGDTPAAGQIMPLPKGQSMMTKVDQGYGDAGGNFHMQGLSPFGFEWEAVPGQDPLVRIYAKGYKRLIIKNFGDSNGKRPYNRPGTTALKWVGQNQTQALQPWPTKLDVQLKELRLWRKDLDENIKAVEAVLGRKRAIESQEKLLLLFNDLCNTLTEQAQKNICYAPGSEIGQYIAQFASDRAKNYLVIEGVGGERQAVPVQIGPDAPTREMLNQGAAPPLTPENASRKSP